MRTPFILALLLAVPAVGQGLKPPPRHATLNTHPNGRTTPPPAPKRTAPPARHRDTTPHVRGAAPMKK